MGQQQLILILLGFILVGIALAFGVHQFGAHSTEFNRDSIIMRLQNISMHAYHQYKLRPATLGGGGTSYVGYVIPEDLRSDGNGTYSTGTISENACELIGVSSMSNSWIVTLTLNDTGGMTIGFSGW